MGGGLLARADLYLVLQTTPLEEIIDRGGARLVVTSWAHIGRRVTSAVHALDPRPSLWVVSGFPLDRVNAEAPARVDRIFDKFQSVRQDALGHEISAFLEADRSA